MSLIRKCVPLALGLASILTVAEAVNKDKPKFAPPALESLTTKASNEGVTIGAVAYTTDEQAESAFGKSNPYRHGVLPVLVVIRNDSQFVVKLDGWKVEYIDKDRERIEPTPAAEVPYLRAPKRPSMQPSPIPGISLGRGKKNPLAAEEIQSRAWAARMVPPGDTAHGFFYFRSGHRSGAKLYLNGLTNARTGKDLFYFEIPFD